MMNNSLKFIQNRMVESGYLAPTAEEASISSLQGFANEDGILAAATLKTDDKEIDIEVVRANEDFEDFDFYTTHAEHNDGTLLFVYDGITDIIQRLVGLRSVPIQKIKSAEDILSSKSIKIIVGDAVIIQKIDKSPDKNRPWMTNSLEIFIPSHFELEK